MAETTRRLEKATSVDNAHHDNERIKELSVSMTTVQADDDTRPVLPKRNAHRDSGRREWATSEWPEMLSEEEYTDKDARRLDNDYAKLGTTFEIETFRRFTLAQLFSNFSDSLICQLGIVYYP